MWQKGKSRVWCVAHLDDAVQEAQVAQIGVLDLPGVGPLPGCQELQVIQLAQEPCLHLGVLHDGQPARHSTSVCSPLSYPTPHWQ